MGFACTSALVPMRLLQALANPEIVEARVIANLTAQARNEWDRLASTELRTSSADYRKGIGSPEFPKPNIGIIMLSGLTPNLVEQGMDAYDMRVALCLNANAKNRKQAADGSWYNTIPFRHGTTGTTGRNFTPMGQAFAPKGENSLAAVKNELDDDTRSAIGKKIQALASRLRPTISVQLPTGRFATAYGGRLKPTVSMGRSGSAYGSLKDFALVPLMRAHHKTDIYQGMIRNRAAYQNRVQTTYMTFRRISTKSPDGWQHPGIKARHLAEKVSIFISAQAVKAMDVALGNELDRSILT